MHFFTIARETADNTAQKKIFRNVVFILLRQTCTGYLCNVVREAPDNIAQEIIVCNVILTLQHCSVKTLCNFV